MRLNKLKGLMPRARQFEPTIVDAKKKACIVLSKSRFLRLTWPMYFLEAFIKNLGYLKVAKRSVMLRGINRYFLFFQFFISGSSSYNCFSVRLCIA